MKEPVYITFANRIAKMIEEGTFKPGDKLPSIRNLHQKKGLSIGTILQSFNYLMEKGLVVSKEKSGYFVQDVQGKEIMTPTVIPVSLSAQTVHIDNLLQRLPLDGTGKNFVSFTNALPDNRLLPFNSIKRFIQQSSRDYSGSYLGLENRYGNKHLREEIAKRSLHWKGAVHADEIVITNGASEAILCCLKAITQPGDTVLVQSPCFFGILQIIECLGLKAVSVPSHPVSGIIAAEVRQVCQKLPVKACVIVSNFNNPDGSSISTEEKKELAALANTLQIPIIEDDLYADLFFKGIRPDTIKTYDTDGWVMYCSSFTKTLAPGLRIGWCAAGRFTYNVARIKSVLNHSTSNFNQQVILQLLRSGALEKHLLKFRLEMQKNLHRYTTLIQQYFPTGTKITQPNGGLYIWIELPAPLNTSQLLEKAIDQGVSYAPGELFSSGGDYLNYLRISYSGLWEKKTELALAGLGKLFSSAVHEF
ncbi:PLP-dependent aminotransferase family protein [Chryseobacterium sp. Tr-659]|uniref:aminotransferase-like domain-containing protein n=1 Tax=Chryseobacterium sp. Tr-659 TaxID=2608340 RepID=UPI00141F4240|nr:PLP-dependent aminotransferase family protein [Chryseobacterium sp. Tr-659]NIF06504.1 PLP-dependent aminotransferase family protein [Chryseobacterium sp. Tr-659]